MSRPVPELPADSIHEPLSDNPSPSRGLQESMIHMALLAWHAGGITMIELKKILAADRLQTRTELLATAIAKLRTVPLSEYDRNLVTKLLDELA